MEWFVLVLMMMMLSLPPCIHTHCSAECQRCARQLLRPAASSRLSCSPDCEDELLDCAPVPSLADITEEQEEQEELVKRYGGFIKRLDKNKQQLFTSSNSVLEKPKLYQELLQEVLKQLQARGAPQGHEDARGFVKRYGGFLRKFGPKSKRSSSGEQEEEEQEESREELQKRYGGFMRRVRPKLNNLKWDKRFGGLGYLRNQVRFSVRSEEEPL